MFTDGSDYIVEQYIKPNKVRKRLINDERADLLGNFDDDDAKFTKKKPAIPKPTVFASEEDPFVDAVDESDDDDEQIPDANDESDVSTAEHDGNSSNDSDNNVTTENSDTEIIDSKNVSNKMETAEVEEEHPRSDATTKTKKSNRKSEKLTKNPPKSTHLTDDQIKALIRGSSKKDRFVLYVTNLNYSTTREELTDFFAAAGQVKSVRVPKVRRSAFAFIEMSDIDGFKVCLLEQNMCSADCVHCTSSVDNQSFCLHFLSSIYLSIFLECPNVSQSNIRQLYNQSTNIRSGEKEIGK